MSKLKCPYTFPHKSRAAKAGYILSIGGYSRGYNDKWPLEFTVATYEADTDFDNLWKKYSQEHMPESAKENPEKTAAYFQLAQRLHKEHANDIWQWGQEDAYRSLSDSDTYRMLYDGKMLKLTLQLHGRGGKHLVITEFEGHTFTGMSDDDLYESLMKQENDDGDETSEYHTLRKGHTWVKWTDKEVDTLYRYVRQCEVDFTTKKASAEVEYQGAWQFFNNTVNLAWEDTLEAIQDHQEYVEDTQRVLDALRALGADPSIEDHLLALAVGAGVHVNEIVLN